MAEHVTLFLIVDGTKTMNNQKKIKITRVASYIEQIIEYDLHNKEFVLECLDDAIKSALLLMLCITDQPKTYLELSKETGISRCWIHLMVQALRDGGVQIKIDLVSASNKGRKTHYLTR